MITTRDGITVTRRETWQPCSTCGISTPFYARFIAPDGKLTVWPFCSIECYERRNRVYREIIENRQNALAYGIC